MTTTEQVSADSSGLPRERSRSLTTSALGMISGKTAAMSLGFAFWLVAARVAPAGDVGLAAGATAAIMLVALLSTSGLGAAAVVHYHRQGERSADVVDTALALAGILACAVALAFLGLAGTLLVEMNVIAVDLPFALLFVLMSVIGSLGVVIDQVSMAQRRGGDVLIRNVTNGIVTLLVPVLIWLGPLQASARVLFAGWVLGSTSAVIIGWFQMRLTLDGHRTRPRLARSTFRPLIATSIANQALTTAERAPGLLLPLLVTELLSPEETAYWYTSWMIAWGVSIVPLSTSTALFAEVCRNPSDIGRQLRAAVRSSLLIGTALAAPTFVLAPQVLRLAGADYADAGATPLRLLVLGVIPLSATYPYFAIARSTGRIGEAIATAAVAAVLGVTCATAAGVMSGLTSMALAWVSVQALIGLWATLRLRQLGLNPAVARVAEMSLPRPFDAAG